MGWYRTGTVSVTNGDATITGSGTAWAANVDQAWAFLGPDGAVYEILSVVSDTEIQLATNYAGSTDTGEAYAMFPTQGLVRALTTQVLALIGDYSAVLTGAGAGKFADGSAAAPGISFASDVDCGFYRIGTNSFGAATAGVERMRIDASGNVIVGGTAAVYGSAGRGVLTLNGSAQALLGLTTAGADKGFLLHDGTNMTLSNTLAGSLILQTNNTERARIDANGNLIHLAPASVPALTAERQLVLNMVSNTVLRVSGRGADGVTRSVDLTLA